jgi:predicted transcriptional regulator
MEKPEPPEKKTTPRAADIMVQNYVHFKPDDEVYLAMNLLLEAGVSGGPVLDDKHHLLGFLSEKDCLVAVSRDVYHNEKLGGKVESFMTPAEGLTTIAPETGLYKTAQLFIHLPYKKLLVVEGDKFLGVVRRSDVLSHIRDHH